jgi:hypothetical protein
MRVEAIAPLAGLLATMVGMPTASAQESQAEWCAVSIARGATTPGGAAGTMTVRNVGRACRIMNFTVPEDRTPTSELEVVKGPAHGRLEIVQPNVVTYTPKAVYLGPDEFQYAGRGPGRSGRILPFSVRISVRVVGSDAPLR